MIGSQKRPALVLRTALSGCVSRQVARLPCCTMLLQVRNLDLGDKGDLKKLIQQKESSGELSAADERKLRSLQRANERELLQVGCAHADKLIC